MSPCRAPRGTGRAGLTALAEEPPRAGPGVPKAPAAPQPGLQSARSSLGSPCEEGPLSLTLGASPPALGEDLGTAGRGTAAPGHRPGCQTASVISASGIVWSCRCGAYL